MAKSRVVVRVRKNEWPELQLNFWLLVMIAAAATELGIFAYFLHVQNTLRLGIPWLFPFQISAGALTLVWLLILAGLVSQQLYFPTYVVIIGSFIGFVLWLTALIEMAIMLYAPNGNVDSYCHRYPSRNGPSEATLVWLQTDGLCQDWRAAFAMQVIGTVFLLWMMVMAWGVSQDNGD